jgi:CDGSH-type Zn-finger protein
MNEKQIMADNKPKKVTLTKGINYKFCACGRSKGQPFCDGSHISTSFVPKVFTVDKDKEAYLCMCKQTKNAPYCDGTHKTLNSGA